MCESRFPLTHKFKNLKDSALKYYQKKNYSKSYQILCEIPFDKMDPACKILLAKSQKMLGKTREAKDTLQSLLQENPRSPLALKEMIQVHMKTHEYQKVLYYFSLLFSIEIDHTDDIRHILSLYHKLGLFDRSFELLETLDNNGFPAVLFLSERVDLAINTADVLSLSQILTRYREYLQNIPDLLCKVLRNIEVGISKNFKDELFLNFGCIHLGSYEDISHRSQKYDQYFFNLNSFYETLLRFTDYTKFHKMKFSSISPYDAQSDVLALILSRILGLKISKENNLDKNCLIVGLHCEELKKTEDGIYFFLQAPPDLEDYPEFVGQIVNNSFQSFIDMSQHPQKQADLILSVMQEKKHISNISYQGQETLYTRFDHSKLDRSHSDVRENVLEFRSSHNLHVFSERNLDLFDHSIQHDGLLYINSYTHKKDLINEKNYELLCQLHQKYQFSACQVPTLLFEFDEKLTLNFYLSQYQKTPNNPNFIEIFHQLNHFLVQELHRGLTF
ncbi:hypothetical protein MJH12_20405 [bacterium]|nr:hypothetical protein [bacterium]